MQTKLSLKPGQNGTKKWTEIYGERLVSVRYRYDAKKGKRFKTVEIIVEERDWSPDGSRFEPAWNVSDMLGIRVGVEESEIREKVKQSGGIWRPRQKLWELSYGSIRALGLEGRIVSGP
jgi:hypothetical protein